MDHFLCGQCEPSIKIMAIVGQIRASSMPEFLRPQKFFITLTIALIITQSSAQDVESGSTLTSTSSLATSSKGGSLSGSKFRENISSVQRAQQQIPIQVSSQQQVNEIQGQQIQQQITNQRKTTQTSIGSSLFESQQQQQQQAVDAEPAIYGSVKGTPGADFPAYTAIPNTKFSCDGAPFEPGLYADESTGCQVYHICYQGRRESFLCGIGTVFNQAIMSCDFWHSVDCSKSSQYYSLNSEFGKSSSEPGATGSLQKRKQFFSSQSVQPTARVLGPNTIQKTEYLVRNIQQQVAAPSQQRKTSRFEESSFSSFGGKVSPPSKQPIQVQSQNSAFNEASHQSFEPATKTSARSSLGSNSQRSSLRFVSPGRRVASLNEQRNQQFSSESAPAQTVAAQETTNEQQEVSSNLVVTNADEMSPTALRGKTSARGLAEMEFKIEMDASARTNSSEGVELKQLQSPDDQIWKPVFRSKTSGKTSFAKATQRAENATNSHPATQSTSSTLSEQAPTSTLAQPNQDPTFSDDGSLARPTNSSTLGESVKMLSAPKSSAPPTPQPTTSTSTQATSERTSIESDVGLAVNSADSAEPTTSSQPSSEAASSTTTEQPPQTTVPTTTTTTTTQPPPATITEQPTGTTLGTRATNATSSEATTIAGVTEDQPTSEQPASESSVESKKKRKKKKKRRGSEQTSLNSNAETSQTTTAKLDASWVEYATV